jgi:hypothetical protein
MQLADHDSLKESLPGASLATLTCMGGALALAEEAPKAEAEAEPPKAEAEPPKAEPLKAEAEPPKAEPPKAEAGAPKVEAEAGASAGTYTADSHHNWNVSRA